MKGNVVLSLELNGMLEKLRVNFCISTINQKQKDLHIFSVIEVLLIDIDVYKIQTLLAILLFCFFII